MNVLIVNWRDVRNPRAGGAETYLHEIATRWVREGHRVRWLTAGFRGALARETIDGIEIARVGNRFTVYACVAFALLRGFAREVDAIVDAENGIPFFTPLFSRAPVCLLIFHVHKRVFRSQLPAPLAALFTFIECRVMPRVYARTRWVTISRSSLHDIAREFRPIPAKVGVVHSGIGRDLRAGRKAAHPTIAYVGRLEPYKRLDALIASVDRLRARVPDVRAIVAGNGTQLDALRRLVHSLGLDDVTSLPGYVSEEQKAEILRSAWVFVSPSSMEGWGIAVIEANASGTPAVGYDVPGLRDAIVHDVTGAIVAEGVNLAETIPRILVDRAERERLAAGALDHARRFDWDATARDFYRAVFGTSGEPATTRSSRSRAT